MAATVRDVAKEAGVSLGTVSKYINGGSVKEVNRSKIARAIEVLEFMPNNIAKGLRNAKTYTIVVLVPSLTDSFVIDIINSVESFLSPIGYSIIVCDCHSDQTIELQKTKMFIQRMVDGIILMPSSSSGEAIDYINSKKIPLIVLDRLIEGHECDAVVLDNEMAGYLPTKHLLEKGHTKIGLMCGDETHYSTRGRIKGYKKAFNELKQPFDERYIVNGHYKVKGGSEAFMKLWALDTHPTGIIASNYDMTLGLFIATNNLKLKIPKDVSVIGFDAIKLADVMSPALSQVGQPLTNIGNSVAQLLFKRLKGDYETFPEVIVHQPYMELRESEEKL